MHRVPGTDLFYYSARVEPDARFNYLFIRDFKETTDPRNPRTTVTTLLGKDMEMSFAGEEMSMSWAAMPQWQAPSFLTEADASRRGRIVSREMDSQTVGEKIPIDVYLPAGYDESDKRYPVAYVHGGESARKLGKLDVALDNLINRRVKPTIVVFIKYQPGFAWQSYVGMVTGELVPFIDGEFRTLSTGDDRASVGSGLSGMTAFSCAMMSQGSINKVAAQSPFIFDMVKQMIETQLTGPDGRPLTIYMDWGTYDLRNPHENWDIADSCRDFARMLKDKGYKVAGGEVHDGPGWSSWRNRADAMFEALFPMTE